MNTHYKHQLLALSIDTQIMDSFVKTVQDSKCFNQIVNKPHPANSCGKSNRSSRSKYMTNSKLIKSNLYNAVRRGKRGSQYHKQQELDIQVNLLRESLSILEKEQQQLCGKMGELFVRLRQQGQSLMKGYTC